MKRPNKFSVKSTMYVVSLKGREVNGPWKPTIEGAIVAFRDMLVKKGWLGEPVFRAFVAERCEEETAPCQDGRGNFYKEAEVLNHARKLEGAGIKIGEVSRQSRVA